jgi:DNA-binding XRE family transcriptional regulator
VTHLAAVLRDLDVSQGELARRAGLTRQTVFQAYHGRDVSLATWVKIAHALRVPMKQISPLAAAELDGLVIGR